MTDYAEARANLAKLHTDFPAGSLVAGNRGNDAPLVVMGHALDSEHLGRRAVVMDPDSREMWLVPAARLRALNDPALADHLRPYVGEVLAIRRFLEAARNPVTFERDCKPNSVTHAGAVVQHYKGGVYSILAVLGAIGPEPLVLYISHGDGTWWVRPWSEFGDGRFDPSRESVLTLGEAGLSAFETELSAAD